MHSCLMCYKSCKAENLYNVQNRDVKGIGSQPVCGVYKFDGLNLCIIFLQQISKHKFNKFTEFKLAKCESRISSTAIKHDHFKLATATT